MIFYCPPRIRTTISSCCPPVAELNPSGFIAVEKPSATGCDDTCLECLQVARLRVGQLIEHFRHLAVELIFRLGAFVREGIERLEPEVVKAREKIDFFPIVHAWAACMRRHLLRKSKIRS